MDSLGLDITSRKVMVLAGCYLPGYKAGGPIRSIENLVAALGREFQFRIVALDRDLGEKLPFPEITANRWVPVGHAEVMYLQPGVRGLFNMCKVLRSVDRNTVLYLNSFFDRRFSMLAMLMRWLRLCRPRTVVLAPRGEFSAGALCFKPLRKFAYLRIVRWLGLSRDVVWHASSNFEATDIHRQLPLAGQIEVAPVIPGSDARGLRDARPKRAGQLRAVFISRFSRMKNLSGALKILKGVSGDVSFNIYGPAEDADYWKECQGLIAGMPSNIRVQYLGEIEHEKVKQVFAEHELFLLPTLGENYGHVIGEALASGCPVLISDQTPWRNLEAEGVGWDIPPGETQRFQRVLQKCVDSDDEWYSALSTRAMQYAAKRSSDPQIIDANRRLFQRAFASS